MNAVVDTNVVAYYLLATEPFTEEVSRFWRAVEQAFELAARQRLPLATFDGHILETFPDVAQRPRSLLSN